MNISFRQALAERSRERERHYRRAARYFWLFYLMIIFCTSVYIVVHPFWFIQEIKVGGTYALSPHSLAQVVQENLSGEMFYLFPRQSFLFATKRKIANDLLEKYPRLNRVRISVEGLNVLLIEVDERRPMIIGCPTELSTSTACFYLDQNGVMFEPSPRFSPGVFFTVVSPLIKPSNINYQILSPNEVVDLPNFVKQIEAISEKQLITDFLIGDTELLANDDVAVRLHQSKNQGDFWELRFSRRNDFAKSLFYFDAAVGTEAFQADWLKSSEALEYIDVRFGKKVFYRFSTYATSSAISN